MNAKHFHLVLSESLKTDFPNLFLSLATHNFSQHPEIRMSDANSHIQWFSLFFFSHNSNSLQGTADHLSLKQVSVWFPHSTL